MPRPAAHPIETERCARTIMQRNSPTVYGGIDTHPETHYVAVIDEHGRRLTDQDFPATAGGYRKIIEFTSATATLLASELNAQAATAQKSPGS